MIHLSEFLRLFVVVSQPFKNVPRLFFLFFLNWISVPTCFTIKTSSLLWGESWKKCYFLDSKIKKSVVGEQANFPKPKQ